MDSFQNGCRPSCCVAQCQLASRIPPFPPNRVNLPSSWSPKVNRARFTFGDHELGKLTLFGGKGGMRLASWHCATQQLGLQPFWKLSLGRYLLMGVASPLIATK